MKQSEQNTKLSIIFNGTCYYYKQPTYRCNTCLFYAANTSNGIIVFVFYIESSNPKASLIKSDYSSVADGLQVKKPSFGALATYQCVCHRLLCYIEATVNSP